MRLLHVLLLLGATLTANVASAAEMSRKSPSAPAVPAISCAAAIEVHSRMLYNNTGTYASSGSNAGQVQDIACGIDTAAGRFYGDVWGYIPYGTFEDGGEVDFRAGWTRQFGRVGIDLSAALYNFRVLGAGTFNTANLRGKVSYDFLAPAEPLVLQVYSVLDYSHSLDSAPDNFALVAGAYAGYKLTHVVEVGVAVEAWHHANLSETILSAGPKATYHWSKSTDLFVKGLWTHGSVIPDDPEPNKFDVAAGMVFRF